MLELRINLSHTSTSTMELSMQNLCDSGKAVHNIKSYNIQPFPKRETCIIYSYNLQKKLTNIALLIITHVSRQTKLTKKETIES